MSINIAKYNVSVIIPVYNVELYLRKCIDSVLAQKGVNYEIILVDDGSTDGSGKICDEYSEQYDNISVIHKMNGGLGMARNSGLDVARGEYIFFLDSDDWIVEGALERLVKLATSENADIVCFESVRVNNRNDLSIVQEKENIEILSRKLAVKKYLFDMTATAWNKLYQSKVFAEERFTDVEIHEDAYSMHLILNRADRIAITNQIYYVQYIRNGSLTQTKFQRKNFLCVKCGERLVEFSQNNYPELIDYAYYNLIERQISMIDLISSSFQYRVYRKEIRKLANDIINELQYIENNSEITSTDVYKNAISIKQFCLGYVIKQEIKSVIYKTRIRLANLAHRLGVKKINEKKNSIKE